MNGSARGPMLGTHTSDRHGRRFRRQDKPSDAGVCAIQKRSARITEHELWMYDLACEFDAVEIIEFRESDRPSPTGVYHADDNFVNGGFWA